MAGSIGFVASGIADSLACGTESAACARDCSDSVCPADEAASSEGSAVIRGFSDSAIVFAVSVMEIDSGFSGAGIVVS